MRGLLVILLCLVLCGCVTGHQKTDFYSVPPEDDMTKRREQFDAFVDGLKVFMPEERVFTLAKDLMEKQIIIMKREVSTDQDKQKVTWHGNVYLYTNLPKDFSLTFNNDKLVTWNY